MMGNQIIVFQLVGIDIATFGTPVFEAMDKQRSVTLLPTTSCLFGILSKILGLIPRHIPIATY